MRAGAKTKTEAEIAAKRRKKRKKKKVQRLYKAAQGFALGRLLCQVSSPISRRWFPSRHKAPVPPVIFWFPFLRFLRLFAAIPSVLAFVSWREFFALALGADHDLDAPV